MRKNKPVNASQNIVTQWTSLMKRNVWN